MWLMLICSAYLADPAGEAGQLAAPGTQALLRALGGCPLSRRQRDPKPKQKLLDTKQKEIHTHKKNDANLEWNPLHVDVSSFIKESVSLRLLPSPGRHQAADVEQVVEGDVLLVAPRHRAAALRLHLYM